MSAPQIVTEEFTVSRSKFLMLMAECYALRPLTALAIAALVAAALGIAIDLRWLIIGLMVVCIVTPMVIAFLYFNYGLRPESFVNIVPHTVRIEPGAVCVEAVFRENAADDNDPPDDSERPDLEEKRVNWRFPIDPALPYTPLSSAIRINLTRDFRGFIYVPYESFTHEENLRAAIEVLRR